MKFSKKLTLGLLLFFILVLISAPIAYTKISDLTEKESLKPPPPYKTVEELKGIKEIKLSTQSGKVKYPHDYVIVLVGDSMTEYLGNSDELRGYLNEYYPNKAFEVLNYSYGSTNILSVPERLEKETMYKRKFRPIEDIDFDLIIIESMGHNPLSQFPLQEGLKKQTETLDYIVQNLQKSNPRARIAFLATLGPNKDLYAKEIVNLTSDARKIWTDERLSYIKNHMAYAKSHNIPIIDVLDKSTDSNGSTKEFYVSKYDHIHPSATGVLLISKTIADFLAQNHFIPN